MYSTSDVLGIDPGNTHSAYALIDSDGRPIHFDKLPNNQLLVALRDNALGAAAEHVAIEMVASYGMAVGADVFETCVWIGRFAETIARRTGHEPQLIKRLPVKIHHCHDSKAKDTNVRQALVDRFAPGQRNHGKGTKDAPGWFYGFHRDIWSAYAIAVYLADTTSAEARLEEALHA